MPKTRKPARVSPPRKPRGEPAGITIGNLRRDVHNLTQRCAELVRQRDSYMEECTKLKSDHHNYGMQHILTAQRLSDVERSYGRLQGWQDCAREVMGVDRAEIRIDRPMIAPGA